MVVEQMEYVGDKPRAMASLNCCGSIVTLNCVGPCPPVARLITRDERHALTNPRIGGGCPDPQRRALSQALAPEIDALRLSVTIRTAWSYNSSSLLPPSMGAASGKPVARRTMVMTFVSSILP